MSSLRMRLNRTYAVDPFLCGLWFVVAQFIALSSGISLQFWHESQFCVSPEFIVNPIPAELFTWFVVSAVRLLAAHKYPSRIVFPRKFISTMVTEGHTHPCSICAINPGRVNYHTIYSE